MTLRSRRWLALSVVALIISPISWAGVAMLATTCGMFDEAVSIPLNDGRDILTLSRRPIWHPILANEYQRYLNVMQAGIGKWRVDLPEDSGGGTALKLFTASPTVFVLVDRFGCYRLDLDRQSLREVPSVEELNPRLIGTFDEDPQSGHDRFIRSEDPQPLSSAVPPDCG